MKTWRTTSLLVIALTILPVEALQSATPTDFLWTGGFAVCINGDPYNQCSADWDEEANWSFDCPLPPPQVCALEYPDDTEDDADLLWQTMGGDQGGHLVLSIVTLTIGALRIGVPSDPDQPRLNIRIKSKDTFATALWCSSLQIVGANGPVTLTREENGEIRTY